MAMVIVFFVMSADSGAMVVILHQVEWQTYPSGNKKFNIPGPRPSIVIALCVGGRKRALQTADNSDARPSQWILLISIYTGLFKSGVDLTKRESSEH